MRRSLDERSRRKIDACNNKELGTRFTKLYIPTGHIALCSVRLFEATFRLEGKKDPLHERRNRTKKQRMANIQTTRTALQQRYISNCQVHLEKTDGIRSVLQLPTFACFDLLGYLFQVETASQLLP
jgi:hypothetical protein